MQNLAGRSRSVIDNDTIIEQELFAADIPAIKAPIEHPNSEVRMTVTGLLGEIVFMRAWYYWCVYCWVPLEAAMEMFEHPMGKKDVRVGGHCGCPSPLEYGTTWINSVTGKRILNMREKIECDKIMDGDRLLKEVATKILTENEFSHDPSKVENAKGFIESYHIDTASGLTLFSKTVRKYDCLGSKPQLLKQ